jgi:DNA-directed RNA polymerase sigma subunit (sigma70/sigma32)
VSRTKGSHDEYRYGATLDEIAAHFGKTREWARQEVEKALSKVRKVGNLEAFKDLVNR